MAYLLGLPRELRDEIYNLVVQRNEAIAFYPQTQPAEKKPAQPAITRTCRQIRQEALPIYYKINRFKFDFGAKPHAIPASISDMHCVEIDVGGLCTFTLALTKGSESYELKDITGLKKHGSDTLRTKIIASIRKVLDEHGALGQTGLTKETLEKICNLIELAFLADLFVDFMDEYT